MKKIHFSLFVLLLLSGCGGTDVSGYRTLPLDQDVTLRVGEKVGLAGDSVTELEFKRIRDDNRCPVNADCIWAGTAFLDAELHKSPFSLTDDAPEPESFSVEWLKDATTVLTVRPRYKIAFVRLSPEAQLGKTIAQGDYRITLRLTRL
ncbi:hypothetical protein [Armatimonas sp.]|uniref:hypothetical protein n=1 Tax=Armatimonas sp. TaxID=1872638 RepID=UPI00286D038E|nr:hypothetical protein [Armatimonas sp.]